MCCLGFFPGSDLGAQEGGLIPSVSSCAVLVCIFSCHLDLKIFRRCPARGSSPLVSLAYFFGAIGWAFRFFVSSPLRLLWSPPIKRSCRRCCSNGRCLWSLPWLTSGTVLLSGGWIDFVILPKGRVRMLWPTQLQMLRMDHLLNLLYQILRLLRTKPRLNFKRHSLDSKTRA